MIFFIWVHKPWKSSHITVRQIWETAGKYTTEWLVSKALFYMSIERKACVISYTHSRTAESLYLLCLIARNRSHIGSGYILASNSFRKGFWKDDVKKEPDRMSPIREPLGLEAAGKARKNPSGGTTDTQQCGPRDLWLPSGHLESWRAVAGGIPPGR